MADQKLALPAFDDGTKEKETHSSFTEGIERQLFVSMNTIASPKSKVKTQKEIDKDIANTINDQQIVWNYIDNKIQPTFKKLDWKEKYEKNKIRDVAIYDARDIPPYGLNLLFGCFFFFFVCFFLQKHERTFFWRVVVFKVTNIALFFVSIFFLCQRTQLYVSFCFLFYVC